LAFQSLTVGQLLHATSCRSEHTSVFSSAALPPNPTLNLALAGSLALQAMTMVVPPLRGLLGLGALGAVDMAVIAGTSIVPLLLNEFAKVGKEDVNDS
jgi:Ca2+-transporting ATPase